MRHWPVGGWHPFPGGSNANTDEDLEEAVMRPEFKKLLGM